MHSDTITAILEKDSLSSEEIDLCIEFFQKNHTNSNVEGFKKLYTIANGVVNESQIFRLISVIESFLNQKDISNNSKGNLLNNKTCFCLMINNKYEALDSAFKFLELKCDNRNEVFLNSNYFFNVYFEDGLYSEAIKVSKNIIEKDYFKEYNVFLKFTIYGNLFLAYAKLKDYNNYKKYLDLSKECIDKMQIDVYTQYYEMTKLSAEALLYQTNKEIINFNKIVEEYQSLLSQYENRASTIFDTVDTHVDILNEMIQQKMYSEAEKICNLLLNKTNSSRYNLAVYKCLKKIYEATSNPLYSELLIKYVNCVEELEGKEAEYYRRYLMRFATLYQISSNYYELLHDYEHDPLTKCYSRGALDNLLEKNTYIDGSLLFFDLNDFKIVNDTYGHNMGDRYLMQFSKRLLKIFAPIGECYRIGGDEFVTIVHSINKEIISKYIEELNTYLRNDNFFKDDKYYGFSVGISQFSSSLSFEMVLKNADLAMYDCKNCNKKYYYKFYEEE